MSTQPQPCCPRPASLRALRLVAQGMTNAQIGAEMGVSERTVKGHLTWAMAALHAKNRTDAVLIALRHGWLPLEVIGRPA